MYFSECRKKYYKHIRKAKAEPTEYLSLIIDAMDQQKTRIPHLVPKSKVMDHVTLLKTHLVGVIVHGIWTMGYIDSFQWPHGSNLTMSIFLEILASLTHLPRKIYIEMDNCGRENKNR